MSEGFATTDPPTRPVAEGLAAADELLTRVNHKLNNLIDRLEGPTPLQPEYAEYLVREIGKAEHRLDRVLEVLG
jgi:hypothetical protein